MAKQQQYQGDCPAQAAQSRGDILTVRKGGVMAAPIFILNSKKLNSLNRLRVAARHNLREIAREIGADGHIDAERFCLNRILRGPDNAQGVMALERQLLADAKVGKFKKDGTRAKMRDDAVRAIELMVSIPADGVADEDQFFDEVLHWIEQRFGVPILSCTVHRDEASPHLHCLILPVKDGRQVGSALIGLYSVLQDDFHQQVASRYGLSRKLRLSAATRKQVAPAVMAALDADPSLMHTPEFRVWLCNAIERSPEAPMELAGLPTLTTRPRERAWVKCFTKPIRPVAKPKPIGFDHSYPVVPPTDQPDDEPTLSCVRVQLSLPAKDPAATDAGSSPTKVPDDAQEVAPPIVPAPQPVIISIDAAITASITNPPDDEPTGQYTRVPDDLPSEWWDGDLGDHVTPPVKPVTGKALAQAAVKAALKGRKP